MEGDFLEGFCYTLELTRCVVACHKLKQNIKCH